MQKIDRFVVALAVFSVASVAPAEAAPPWCAGYESKSRPGGNARWAADYYKKEGFGEKTLEYVAKATCDDPGNAAEQNAWRKRFQDDVGGSERDFTATLRFAIMEYKERDKLQKEQCSRLESDDQDDVEAIAERRAVQRVFGCKEKKKVDLAWWLDRPQIDEVHRVALVHECLPDGLNPEAHRGDLAFCWVDLKSLDRARFAKALAAHKPNAYGHYRAVLSFGAAKAKADKYVARYEALAAKDKSWKQLIAAPQTGWNAWIAQRERNASIYDAIGAFERKLATGSKKAVEGCDAGLRKLFYDQIKQRKAKTIEEATAVVKEPVGFAIALALMQCEAAQGHFLVASTVKTLFFGDGHPKLHRGPRFGSYYATLDALNEILADRGSFAMKKLPHLPDAGAELIGKAYSATFNQVSHGNAEGQIAKIKPGKNGATHVTFKTVRWQEPKYHCKDTNRIERIDESGNVQYQQNCKVVGTENMSSTEQPIDVPSELAAGLAPGQLAKFALDTKTGRIGIPVAVYADAKKTKLVGLFGVTW